MDVQNIYRVLKKDFRCSLQESTIDIPIDLIIVNLIGEDTDFTLEIGFIPDDSNQLEDFQLLQFVVTIPCRIKTRSAQDQTAKLILNINNQAPLMGFVYDFNSSNVFFRHLMILTKATQDQDGDLIKETIYLISYILELFYPTINAIALGQKKLTDLF